MNANEIQKMKESYKQLDSIITDLMEIFDGMSVKDCDGIDMAILNMRGAKLELGKEIAHQQGFWDEEVA